MLSIRAATATTELYTLSLHDALPILTGRIADVYEKTGSSGTLDFVVLETEARDAVERAARRSEEHTSELQSREKLVCRLLLEKKKETLKEDFMLPGLTYDATLENARA